MQNMFRKDNIKHLIIGVICIIISIILLNNNSAFWLTVIFLIIGIFGIYIYLVKIGVVKKNSTKQSETVTTSRTKYNNNSNFLSDYNLSDYDINEKLYNAIVEFVVESNKASASLLQRKFGIGYSEACKYIDIMEQVGIIGPQVGSIPRKVLVKFDDTNENIVEEKEEASEHLKQWEGESKFDVGKLENILLANDSNNLLNEYLETIKENINPRDLKLVFLEYIRMSFYDYSAMPSLLAPVLSDPKRIKVALKRIKAESERRYDVFKESKVRSIYEYNDLIKDDEEMYKMPFINIVIDEGYNFMLDEENKELLLNLLLDGKQTGIRVTIFSKFSKRNISIGALSDCIKIYDRFDVEKYFNSLGVVEVTDLEKIDKDMNGFDFENYTKELLIANGFDKVSVTKCSNDFGVDVIAYKDDVKYAIQCKKYSSPVGIKAVQEIIGSKSMNGCHVGVVLTNNTFTKSAIELASKNNVLLWDRKKLEQMIENWNKE